MKRHPKFAGVASGLLLAAIGFAMSPAFADCPCDLAVAAMLIDRLPEGRQKEIVIREMKLAMAAPMLGIEKPCMAALPICVGELACLRQTPKKVRTACLAEAASPRK